MNCDMKVGPCSCGAWHGEGNPEAVDSPKSTTILWTKFPENKPVNGHGKDYPVLLSGFHLHQSTYLSDQFGDRFTNQYVTHFAEYANVKTTED